MSKTTSTGSKIGKYLQYQRKKRKLSLEKLAKRTDLTPSFLFRLEKKEYQTVNFEVIKKLARGLEMSADDFMVKCGLISQKTHLRSLNYFLEEKYQFPPEAIEEAKLFIEFLKRKYQRQIERLKKQHQKYLQKGGR